MAVVLFDVIYTPELLSHLERSRARSGRRRLARVLPEGRHPHCRALPGQRPGGRRQRPAVCAGQLQRRAASAGPAEIRLTVFGKLLRDAAPSHAAHPARRRRLPAQGERRSRPGPDAAHGRESPDREKRAPGDFSDAEWQSEERTRHLDEFAKDIGLARKAISQFDPALPVQKSACLP
ncbi:hypothetical protein LP420_08435 [Massilia sp. B-10]|nr:hypothetical protein LP420_08435 [Massilia sp. B-10]